VASSSKLTTFQMRTVSSSEPEAMCVPLDEKATDCIELKLGQLKADDIPDAHGVILRARGNVCAVGRERNRIYQVLVTLKLSQVLEAHGIPNAHGESDEPEAMCVPSGENATELIEAW
jgi:hypothetical protein